MTNAILAATIFLGALANSVLAQDMSACQDSFEFPGLQGGSVDFPSFDTSNFRTTLTYDPDTCAGVYLRVDALRNAQADISHPCDDVDLDGTSSQIITCNRVVGTMATYGTWSIPGETLCSRGCMPWFDSSPLFRVTRYDNPSASGSYRRRAIQYQIGELPHPDLQCPRKRQTTCKIPGRNSWECVDTRSKLDSCGGCPGTEESKDCSEIQNASEVSCRRGPCIDELRLSLAEKVSDNLGHKVHALAGYSVSSDELSCITK